MNRLRLAFRVLFGRAFAVEIPTYDKDWSIDWTESDEQWFDHISRSVPGAKIFKMLRQEVANVAIWAVNAKDSVRCCGYAAGAAYVVDLLENCLPEPEDKPVPLTEEEQMQADIEEALSE